LDSKIQTELSRLKSELDNFKTVFDAHTHNFSGATASSCTAGGAVGTCTGSTVTSSTPFPPPASPGETASQLVKIDS
jgi:hypothetical protein